ncbi:Hypothetical_protein [Hexamita inflata]|uniref:Hypothetical_protein n=1 Tax=Hexamita inflata TaxID=28002 RepID=A0AA86PWE5_9EUKA|nr:Hypothetical protein HINF_LOCUS29379 [Hexamita inflata]
MKARDLVDSQIEEIEVTNKVLRKMLHSPIKLSNKITSPFDIRFRSPGPASYIPESPLTTDNKSKFLFLKGHLNIPDERKHNPGPCVYRSDKIIDHRVDPKILEKPSHVSRAKPKPPGPSSQSYFPDKHYKGKLNPPSGFSLKGSYFQNQGKYELKKKSELPSPDFYERKRTGSSTSTPQNQFC